MHKKKPFIVVAVFILILFIIFFAKTASFYPFLFQLIFTRGINLKQTDNRINILLLGIGGGSHDGPNLTDTIMLASLDPKNDKVTLISIPRDFWFPQIDQKINNAYANGLVNGKGGLNEAESSVAKITGLGVDYGVRIDFSGFVKAVDIVGGLDIVVDNTFDDYQYPIDGKEDDPCGYTPSQLQSLSTTPEDQLPTVFPCRYIHIHFNKGLQHMDGATALEFVRSRHATGVEGSDFARSKRQEKVISAFKSKVLSARTLTNPGEIIGLYDTLKSSIDTDIKQDEFDDFIRLADEMKRAKLQSTVLDTGDPSTQRPGLLINPPSSSDYNYEWVLIPRIGNGNYKEIQSYISCEIMKGNCAVSSKPSY